MIWNKFHINIDHQIAHYLLYNKVLGLLSLVECKKTSLHNLSMNINSSSKLFLVQWEELAKSSPGQPNK